MFDTKSEMGVKTFPETMKGKKIMYVHGFMSSAQTHTVELLQRLMPNAKVIAEDLPIHPADAMNLLMDMCGREKPDLIIGTSMGGMYAEMLYGFDRILINPAFRMGQTMKKYNLMGLIKFQNPRKDGMTEFFVDKQLVKEYDETTRQCFSNVTEDEKNRVFGLFGDSDSSNTFDLFGEHYDQAIWFHGGHRLVESTALHYLMPFIRYIDDRQQHREHPIVYIDYDTVVGDDGKALSAVQKAYETLIENYDVYVVASSPTNNHEYMNVVANETERILSAPAWNRLIFTNRKDLLYGDYLISRNPPQNSMASVIKFGSDEFKTWEAVMTYFARLGGQ